MEPGSEIRCAVPGRPQAVELMLAAAVVGAAVGAALLWGHGPLGAFVAGVVGLVLGHVPVLAWPRRGEVGLQIESDSVRWEHRDEGRVLDTACVELTAVRQVIVLPHEGAGWGLELAIEEPGQRRRLWTPWLPLPSREVAEAIAQRIRVAAPAIERAPTRADEARMRVG